MVILKFRLNCQYKIACCLEIRNGSITKFYLSLGLAIFRLDTETLFLLESCFRNMQANFQRVSDVIDELLIHLCSTAGIFSKAVK
jgi:hypothetical protein